MLEKYEQIMKPEDVAAVLGVSRNTVIKMAKQGVVKYIRVGKFYRFLKEDVEFYMFKNHGYGPRKGGDTPPESTVDDTGAGWEMQRTQKPCNTGEKS